MSLKNILGIAIVALLLLSSCHEDGLVSSDAVTTDSHRHSKRCNSTEHTKSLLQDPTYKHLRSQRLAAFEKGSASIGALQKAGCSTQTIVPVAVHYQGVSSPDHACLIQMAKRQIEVLNEDFTGTNPDISKWTAARSAFNGVDHGEMCVKFVLADRNHPAGYGLSNGQPAVTINRTQGDTDSRWSGYLNVFVMANTGSLGYAPLGGAGDGDGVVIDYTGWGVNTSCGSVAPESDFNLGRTLTHEVGHYLLLDHIWGDGCGVDDQVSDTPDQANSYEGCPTIGQSSCGSPDLHMNYMDYSDDACLYMFSAEQVSRMTNYLRSSLSNITSNANNVYSGSTSDGGVTCDTPSGLSVSATGVSTITAAWTSVDNATRYRVRYRVQGETYSTQEVTSTSVTIDGLNAGMRYEISVKTLCADESSPYSATTVLTLEEDDEDQQECMAPSDIEIEVVNTTSVRFSWSEIPGAHKYRLRYREQGASRWIGRTTARTNRTIRNLKPSKYEYQMRSRCDDGWTPWTTISYFDLSMDDGDTREEESYTIVITLDDYGSETSWGLQDGNNRQLATDGPFDDGAAGSEHKKVVSLGIGCYKLTIVDTYGDGMCCDYGQGRLEMFDADGYKVLESDGNFGSEEVLEFCIESGQARLKNKHRDQKKLSRSKKK